ncbi:MAG TPA: fluoride efflux transporter CrcB [Allosphingosinicella sp.]|jgi:fluoride exporter|nr:fluoride efflux transporter CrcB [Allosphingosinicella sp.]
MAYFIVFFGAGLGGMLRHGANVLAVRLLGPGFPYGTLFVNVAGGFLMGVLAQWLLLRGIGNQPLRLFLTTGFLGGFTTFSAFSLEAAVMWQRGDHALCVSYGVGSLALSIVALFCGMTATRALA